MENFNPVCPKCGCAETKRERFPFFDRGNNFLLICLVFMALGIPIGIVPFMIMGLTAVVVFILKFMLAKSGTWAMTCSRCGETFFVPAPDRDEAVSRFRNGMLLLLGALVAVLVGIALLSSKGTKTGKIVNLVLSVVLFGGGTATCFFLGRFEQSRKKKIGFYIGSVLAALFTAVCVFGTLVASGAFDKDPTAVFRRERKWTHYPSNRPSWNSSHDDRNPQYDTPKTTKVAGQMIETGTGVRDTASPRSIPSPASNAVSKFANFYRETTWHLFYLFAPESVRYGNLVYSHDMPGALVISDILCGYPFVGAEPRMRRHGYTMKFPLITNQKYMRGEPLFCGDYIFVKSPDEISPLSPFALRELTPEESAEVDKAIRDRTEKAAREKRERLLAEQTENEMHATNILARIKLVPMDYIMIQKSLRRHLGTPVTITEKWKRLKEAQSNEQWLEMLSILNGSKLELFPSKSDTDALVAGFASENCSVRFKAQVPQNVYPVVYRISKTFQQRAFQPQQTLADLELERQMPTDLNWHSGGGVLTFKPSEPIVIAIEAGPYPGMPTLYEQQFMKNDRPWDFEKKIDRGELTPEQAHELSIKAVADKAEKIVRWLDNH